MEKWPLKAVKSVATIAYRWRRPLYWENGAKLVLSQLDHCVLYVETCNFGETNPQYRAPENENAEAYAKWDMFWWRRQDLRLYDVNTNVCGHISKV